MPDHQARQLLAVDEDDALAQQVGGLACRRREGRRRDEQALGGLETVEVAEEIPDG